MRKEITVSFHIGNERIERLTEDHKERLAQRLSETMSRYYTARPEEYLKLKGIESDEIPGSEIQKGTETREA